MKILIVTQYYAPENFRINDLSRELHARGHRVTILTGKPNYPAGDFYPGYSMFGKDSETIEGIPVIRVPLTPRKSGSVRLILNYFSFAFFASGKVKAMKVKDFDIIYVFETSPITVALPAIAMKKRIHVPIIMNVQDLWPENVVSITGLKNKFGLRMLDSLVNHIYKHCDCILTASKSFVPRVQERVSEKDKVKFWPQYSVVTATNEIGELPVNKENFNIIFTGNLGEAQGLSMVVEAAKLCKEQRLPDGKCIQWHLVGDGRAADALKEQVKQLEVEQDVIFHGSRPEQEIPAILNQADAALLILKPDPIFDMTLPAKLQTYLACGTAILACVRGESKTLVEESESGMVTDNVSADALAKTVLKMSALSKEQMSRYRAQAQKISEECFTKEHIITKLEEYMRQLTQ